MQFCSCLIIISTYKFAAYVTLIPAGIIAGVGEATLWPVMTLFCVHYACCFAHYATKDPRIYATELIGVLYFLHHLSSVSKTNSQIRHSVYKTMASNIQLPSLLQLFSLLFCYVVVVRNVP